MRRFLSLAAFAVTLSVAVSCTPEGVGDPCEPESCPPKEDDPSVCDWQAQEVYLEHFSLQCRTRVCMVFRVSTDSVWDPYCTRRCGPGAAYTGCPQGYACTEVIGSDTPHGGCYCVDKDQLSLVEPYGEDLDKVAACK